MTHATVTTKIHQALDAHRDFTTQIAFDCNLAYFITQTLQVTVRQLFDLDGTLNTSAIAYFLCACATDPVNRSQCNFGMLMIGNIYACYTSHVPTCSSPLSGCDLVIRNTENRELYLIRITQSTLTLFMAWISTNDPDNTIATNDFAIAANTLDRSHNFHLTSPDI
jgi:hypothetical protein